MSPVKELRAAVEPGAPFGNVPLHGGDGATEVGLAACGSLQPTFGELRAENFDGPMVRVGLLVGERAPA